MTVAVKVGHTHQAPVRWKSRATGPSSMNIAVHVPNRCLVGAGIIEDNIRLPVVVKVSWHSRPGWLPEGESSTHSGGKGTSHSGRSEFVDRVTICRKQIAHAVKGQGKRSKPGCKGVSRSSRTEFIGGARECLKFG